MILSSEVTLPSMNINRVSAISPWKGFTVSFCENGAKEPLRYQVMVGMGLPADTQMMLTESPSCNVTVPFRFMVVGTPV